MTASREKGKLYSKIDKKTSFLYTNSHDTKLSHRQKGNVCILAHSVDSTH